MSLLDSLVAFFSRPAADTAGEVPEGLCGNCWGHEAYDGQIRKVIKDRQINVNNAQERYAFIQDFAVNRVNGIKLKNDPSGEGDLCPSCHTRYRRAGR